jgi:outer membrane protein assembly factor BamB
MKRLIPVLAVVVTLLVAAACGTPAADAPTTPPSSTTARQQWVADGDPSSDTVVIRSLTVQDLLIVVTQRDVTAFDRATGAQRWFVHSPDYEGRGTAFCGASRGVDSVGRLALSIGFVTSELRPVTSSCVGVLAIDTAAGRITWDAVLAYERGSLSGRVAGMPVEVVGDVAIVAWDVNLYGLDMRDGKVAWKRQFQSGPELDHPNCPTSDMMPTSAGVVLLTHCVLPDGRSYYGLVDMDRRGVPRRTHDLSDERIGAELGSAGLVSADPVVVSARPHDPADQRTLTVALTNTWELGMVRADPPDSPGAVVAVPAGFATPPAGAYSFRNRALAADDDVLYSVTPPNRGAANRIVAHDTETGEELWTHEEPGRLAMQVLAVEEEQIVVLQSALDDVNDHSQSVVALRRHDGSVLDRKTSAPENPNGGPAEATFYEYLRADGRAYGIHVNNTDRYHLVYTVG